MSFNPVDIQQSSETISLKLLQQGAGSFVVVPNSLDAHFAEGISEVFHGFGSDELLWQVTFTSVETADSNVLTPYTPSDGRVSVISYVDSTNLYVGCMAQSAGDVYSTFTVNYTYRLLVP